MPGVMVQCDVCCDTPEQPRYRVWVRDELFAEREWRWGTECYLEEMIGVSGEPGIYPVRVETVPGSAGAITVTRWRVTEGPAQIDQQGNLRIQHENT